MLLPLLAVVDAASAGTGAPPVTVLHVIADDLGYQDLGHFNGGKTVSPQINARIEEGILLRQYYTYKVCGPSRAAIMTGRYPWAMGYYDMEGQEAVPLEYTMLPEVLQRNGWSTHALGKWNLGHLVKEYTPTFRGFDTFFGYYAAAIGDYWWHGQSLPGCDAVNPWPWYCGGAKENCSAFYRTDMSNSSGQGATYRGFRGLT